MMTRRGMKMENRRINFFKFHFLEEIKLKRSIRKFYPRVCPLNFDMELSKAE